jgi:hypothetical protein
MASSLEAIGLSQAVRVAFVDSDRASLPHPEFAARVATSRGWQVQAFASKAAAAAWLHSD